MSAAKAKGTAAETAVVNYLKAWFAHVERRTTEGKYDRGDINLSPAVVIEVKNQKTMKLSEWIGELNTEMGNSMAMLGGVWHKRVGKTDPGQWYVTMDGNTFKEFLLALYERGLI